jgi:hypothetical protein
MSTTWAGPNQSSTVGPNGLVILTWRFHAFFTTTDATVADKVAADKTHRAHAIIEQVHADLKHSALAHMPSGVFTANAPWLVLAIIAFNLTRAAATITGPGLARATTATIRRKLIAVPARTATSARRVTCTSRPTGPGEPPGTTYSPESADHQQRQQPDHPADTGTRPNPERPGSEASPTATPTHPTTVVTDRDRATHYSSVDQGLVRPPDTAAHGCRRRTRADTGGHDATPDTPRRVQWQCPSVSGPIKLAC